MREQMWGVYEKLLLQAFYSYSEVHQQIHNTAIYSNSNEMATDDDKQAYRLSIKCVNTLSSYQGKSRKKKLHKTRIHELVLTCTQNIDHSCYVRTIEVFTR